MIFQRSRYSNPYNYELLQVTDSKIGRKHKHWVYFTKEFLKKFRCQCFFRLRKLMKNDQN